MGRGQYFSFGDEDADRAKDRTDAGSEAPTRQMEPPAGSDWDEASQGSHEVAEPPMDGGGMAPRPRFRKPSIHWFIKNLILAGIMLVGVAIGAMSSAHHGTSGDPAHPVHRPSARQLEAGSLHGGTTSARPVRAARQVPPRARRHDRASGRKVQQRRPRSVKPRQRMSEPTGAGDVSSDAPPAEAPSVEFSPPFESTQAPTGGSWPGTPEFGM